MSTKLTGRIRDGQLLQKGIAKTLEGTSHAISEVSYSDDFFHLLVFEQSFWLVRGMLRRSWMMMTINLSPCTWTYQSLNRWCFSKFIRSLNCLPCRPFALAYSLQLIMRTAFGLRLTSWFPARSLRAIPDCVPILRFQPFTMRVRQRRLTAAPRTANIFLAFSLTENAQKIEDYLFKTLNIFF